MAAAVAVVVAVAGIPGAPVRPLSSDLVAPPVPPEVKGRAGAVDVAVRDRGGPVRGARVQALVMVDDRAYLADARDTDAAGHAHLGGLPEGEVWLLASASGRTRATSHLVVTAEARLVEMMLDPEHWIDVSVRDELGVPVADAELEVSAPGDDLPFGARVGGDGTARVGRLPAGPWRLTARAPGFGDETARATRDGQVVPVVLRKLGALAVHVVGADDRGLPGARVSVAGANLWPARAADADAAGDVRIGGLAAGTYALRARSGSLVSPIELGVPLGRGETRQVVLKVSPGRFVAVHVTDGDASDAVPVAGARLTLAEGGLSPFPLEATTDAGGRARLGPVAPGTSALGVSADGFMPRGGVLLADPPPPETRIALVRAGVLTGRVVDARGYPVDGATIEIVGSDLSGGPIFDDPRRTSFQAAHFEAVLGGPTALVPAGELGVVPGPVAPIPHAGIASGFVARRGGPPAAIEPWVTRNDGEFRAAPASPGRVRAVVRHPQYVEVESEVVSLAPGGEARVEVVMRAGGTLEGRVLDAHDRPVEGARVLASAIRGSMERTTRSARDGTFAFAALPESVSLTAAATDDEEPAVRIAVAIPEGGRQEVTVRLPEPREPLPVSVVDEGGWPVDAVQLSATSLSVDAPVHLTAFTDSHGDAVLKRARGVPLRVEARAPGRAPAVAVTDPSTDALKIELAPAETASGEVVTARGGDAIAGAEVTLYTDLGVRRARTDARGAFSLVELAPGPARLRARAAGFAPATTSIVVPDSRGRRGCELPKIELAQAGVVTGEVVDARGDPVAGARVAEGHVPTWLLIGSNPEGIVVTDRNGAFSLAGLSEGSTTLEAYAPDLGRGSAAGVKVVAGRTTDRVRIVVGTSGAPEGPAPGGAQATGSVAVTLGETGAPTEVVIVSVVEGSEAERAGLAPGDVLLDVDGEGAHTMDQARARLSGPIAEDVVVHVRRGDRTLALRASREPVRR